MLPSAIHIIKYAKDVNEHRFQEHSEYWELLGKNSVKGERTGVVLRKAGSGQIIFLSIM